MQKKHGTWRNTKCWKNTIYWEFLELGFHAWNFDSPRPGTSCAAQCRPPYVGQATVAHCPAGNTMMQPLIWTSGSQHQGFNSFSLKLLSTICFHKRFLSTNGLKMLQLLQVHEQWRKNGGTKSTSCNQRIHWRSVGCHDVYNIVKNNDLVKKESSKHENMDKNNEKHRWWLVRYGKNDRTNHEQWTLLHFPSISSKKNRHQNFSKLHIFSKPRPPDCSCPDPSPIPEGYLKSLGVFGRVLFFLYGVSFSFTLK